MANETIKNEFLVMKIILLELFKKKNYVASMNIFRLNYF